MHDYFLSGIFIYPVKSLPGISLEIAEVKEKGFANDRRWMLVDSTNNFITQRFFPQMVFIKVEIVNDKLKFISRRNQIEPLEINISDQPQKFTRVRIWDDIVDAVEYSKEINSWFSKVIETDCKLVYMPNSTKRLTSTKYFDESKSVSFADGYPYLIIGEESLRNLNSKLNESIKMSQFRPNIVFRGGIAHDEDNWKNIKIGRLKFTVGKPCARCVITTINPNSGLKNKEPLATLSKYRNFDGKVMFGQNAIANTEGTIKLGDKIEII